MKDFCENCKKWVEQIDLGSGEFGCPFCRKDNNIITFYNNEKEELEE